MLTVELFSIIELLAGVSAAGIAAISWLNREQPGAVPLFLMSIAAMVYGFISSTSVLVSDPFWWQIVASLKYPLTIALAIGSVYLVDGITQRNLNRSQGVAVVLSGIFIASLTAAVTNPIHQLLITDSVRSSGVFLPSYGPLFWLNTVIALAIILVSIVILFTEFVAAEGIYREQIVTVTAAALIGVGFFFWEAVAPVHPALNLATVGITGWCGITLWGVTRFGLLDTAPVARESVIDSMDDAVLAIDTDGIIVDVNPRAMEWFDIDTDAVGEPIADVLAGQPSLLDTIGTSQMEDVVTLPRGAAIRHARVSLTPVYETRSRPGRVGDREQLVGRTIVVSDITEQREREQELQRLRDLLEQTERLADVGGWELDGETEDLFLTDNFVQLFGYESDESVSLETVLQAIHEEDRPRAETAIDNALNKQEAFDMEARFRRSDAAEDELRWLRSQGVPILDEGESVKLRGAVQDITEQVRNREQLQRQNDRLEQYANVVSHDLRNPLGVALGRLDVARETGDPEQFAVIERSLERMDTLIDDLLTLAREGQTVEDPEVVALDTLARDAWTVIDADNTTVSITTDQRLLADRSRLRQLFENCFRNAVEHGTSASDALASKRAIENGHTRQQADSMRAETDEHAETALTITVGDLQNRAGFYIADNGEGIPEADREGVFEAGYSTSVDGTGLGLEIVQTVAEAHDWSISLTESEDGGVRLEFAAVERPQHT